MGKVSNFYSVCIPSSSGIREKTGILWLHDGKIRNSVLADLKSFFQVGFRKMISEITNEMRKHTILYPKIPNRCPNIAHLY
jgi:hypothetical protein